MEQRKAGNFLRLTYSLLYSIAAFKLQVGIFNRKK